MFLIFLFLPLFFIAQNITGTIVSVSGDKIPVANIILKESANTDKISQFTIAKNGTYSITLKKKYERIFLEVSSVNYETVTKEFNFNTEKLNSFDFILKEEKVKSIQEVVINQSKEAFKIKEDTVVYDVAKYKDPSDRKVQDVLKKMPGITVNDKTGEIKYKGKSVETVKLEGDDLFGTNYTVGTKNINIDIVEKVEAIENYSDNPLLKGIESSDKVALNLKIKKGKIDFSGNIDWGSGFNSDAKQMSSINSTLLQITKGFKSFLNFSYNNIGVNQSPYDYFSNNLSIDQQKDSNYSAEKVISDNSFASFLDNSRGNRNNSIFGSYNFIFKPFKNNTTRANISYLKDKLLQNIYNESVVTNENLITSDNYDSEKTPELFRIEVNSKTNTSKRSLLEYRLTGYRENSSQYSSIIQNNIKNFETTLLSENIFLKQNLQYTYKLNEKSAIQFNATYSWNDIPQDISSNPKFSINENENFSTQTSNFEKSVLDTQLTFLGKANNIKYLFSIGNINEKNSFRSGIHGANSSIGDLYSNLFTSIRNSYYAAGQINFNFSNFFIQPSFNLNYLMQNVSNLNLSVNRVLLEPSLYLKYKINETSQINSITSYKQRPFSEDKLIVNPVFISNRDVISSMPSLEIQQTFNSRLNYVINDLYKQLNFNIGIFYTKDKGNYFSELTISPFTTNIRYFYSPNVRSNCGADLLYDKYFSFLDSVLKFGSNVSFSNYENILNKSELRKIKSITQTYDFTWRTVFDFKLNFENKFTYNINSTQVQNNEKNILNSFNNSFRIISRPLKKLSIISNFDYFVPNINNKSNYLFIDNTIKYSINRSWETSFFIKNLLNRKQITEVDITDYSVNTTNILIIPRYFLLNVTYNF